MFNTRTDAAGKYGYATVAEVHGVIILPDDFTDPMKNNGSEAFNPQSTTGWNDNVYTAGDWTSMESAGAVFLPAAGARFDSEVCFVGKTGHYWSSTVYDSDGLSVRLVTEL